MAPQLGSTHRKRAWRWALMFCLAPLAAVAAHLAWQGQTQQRLQERVALGCLDVADCRALVQAAEAQQAQCWYTCQSDVEAVSQTRRLFRSALERQAEREQAQRNAAFANLRSKRREAHEAQVKAAQAEARGIAEREHQRTLERLAAEAERLKALQTAQHAQEVRYLEQLSPLQRRERLSACHEQRGTCEALVGLLLEAAPGRAEKRQLIDAQERYATAGPTEAAGELEPWAANVEGPTANNR